MKYKIYYNGSACYAIDSNEQKFLVKDSKQGSKYPYEFETDIYIENDVLICDVYPKNSASETILDHCVPEISRYNRIFSPRKLGTVNPSDKLGKMRHWRWSRWRDSKDNFYNYSVITGGRRYSIEVADLDRRLTDPDYAKTLMSYGQYRYNHQYNQSYKDFSIAVRIVLVRDDMGDDNMNRTVCASAPVYLYFSWVGGGTYESYRQLTENEFVEERPSFAEE